MTLNLNSSSSFATSKAIRFTSKYSSSQSMTVQCVFNGYGELALLIWWRAPLFSQWSFVGQHQGTAEIERG